MTPLHDTPIDTLGLMFRAACEELACARLSQRTKDTPAARLRVAACLTAVDSLLDARNAQDAERRRDTSPPVVDRPEPAGTVPAF